MSKLIKTILVGLAILFGAVILYGFIFQPLGEKIAKNAAQIRSKEAELRVIKDKVARLPQLQQALKNAQAVAQSASPMIPAELPLSELYSQLETLAQASGIKVKQISTNQTFSPFAKERHLQYIAVNLEGTAYFSQVMSFLDLLAKSEFLIQVEKLDLSSITKGNQPRLHFKITLNAFEYASGL